MQSTKIRIDPHARGGVGRTPRVLGRSLGAALLCPLAGVLLSSAGGCSSAPEPVVPARALPNGALVLGAVSDGVDSSRLDARLGASRLPQMREVESAEYWVVDRQREFNGRPLNTYRATTFTRERRVR